MELKHALSWPPYESTDPAANLLAQPQVREPFLRSTFGIAVNEKFNDILRDGLSKVNTLSAVARAVIHL